MRVGVAEGNGLFLQFPAIPSPPLPPHDKIDSVSFILQLHT
jgi:hypothetical protein